ncbi:MAG: hypothetical protein AAF701_08365, partial [Pseudomonadota bacterium]
MTPPMELNPESPARTYGSADNEYRSAVVTLRSFNTNAKGDRVEFAGARCTGRNAVVGFKNVITPGQITLPAYLQAERYENRGKPPALKGSCTYDGTSVDFTLDPTSAVGNVVTSGTGYYNAATRVYSTPTTSRLTSRLSPTLPW